MGKYIDRSGQRYGRLVVVADTGRRQKSGGSVIWKCLCDCGKEADVSSSCLKTGQTKSCGCLFIECAIGKGKKKKTHGMTNTPTYRSWSGAKDRCRNENNKKYHLYGGRGIKVSNDWDSFENFLKDMGEAPKGKSLDRIDVNGNYDRFNCRWATQEEQQNNRRDNVYIEYKGERLTIAMYAKKYNLNQDKIQRRLKSGYSIEDAIKP